MAKIKSQEAAFRDARKPKPKPKTPHVNNIATPKGVSKNASRNERRKAARKTAMLLKSQGIAVSKKGKKGGEEEEGKEKDVTAEEKKMDGAAVVVDGKMDIEEDEAGSGSDSSD